MREIIVNEDLDITVEFDYEENPVGIEFRSWESSGRAMDDSGNFTIPLYQGKEGEDVYNLEEAENFISGLVKWDGCSHYYFGEEDGYIHLCGKRSIQNISKIIEYIYLEAGKRLASRDEDEFAI